MWQNWQFLMEKFANFCGKNWQNLGFQMAIFCDARQSLGPRLMQTAQDDTKEDISFAKSDQQSIFAFTVLPQRPLAEQAYKS